MRVHLAQVVVLIENFDEEFPVTVDRKIALARGYQGAEPPGLVHFLKVTQPVVERRRLGINVDKQKTGPLLAPDLHQTKIPRIKTIGAIHTGGCGKTAIQSVAPSMKRADELTTLAPARLHQTHPPVTTGIGKNPKAVIVATGCDEGRIGNRERQIIPGVCKIHNPASTDPASSEKTLALKSQNLLIDVACGRQRVGLLGWAQHLG